MGALGTARNIPLGLPFQGMDLQTPLASLPMSKAPFIENFFIDGQTLKVRFGSAKFSQFTGAVVGDAVLSLGSYKKADGTESLYGHKSRAGVYSICDFSAAVGTTAAATSMVSNCVYIQFRNYFYVLNGLQTPSAYDGTDWAGFGGVFATSGLTAGFTGPASVATFASGIDYKNRLYLVENGSTRAWYGGVDSISGAMTSFDISSLLSKGGNLHNVCTINYGQNNAAANYICFVSNQGEVLVYQGSYPGSTNFEIVAKFQMGKPLSRRCYLKYQGDTLVVTDSGLVSLREMISYALGNAATSVYKTYSNPIDPYWKSIVKGLRLLFSDAGIESQVSIEYFKKTGCIYILFKYIPARTNNVLASSSTLNPIMFVFNTNGNAWATYKYTTNGDYNALVEHSSKLMTGLQGLGLVYELEKDGLYGDEKPLSLGTYDTITTNILSAALSAARDSGQRQKFNSLELYAYINAGSASNPVECYLVENFGKVSGTTKPAVIEDEFNSIPLNVGSSREYVQYSLTVKTNSSSGDPTVLYNLNALMEQGGYR
jgi:hypothetical protein